jgi:hypothetical protein
MARGPRFQVIVGAGQQTVLDRASEMLSNGWRLHGPISHFPDGPVECRFQQAVVLEPQRYVIVKESSPEALQREVNHAIGSGLAPHGPMVVEKLNGQVVFIQAMCLAPIST